MSAEDIVRVSCAKWGSRNVQSTSPTSYLAAGAKSVVGEDPPEFALDAKIEVDEKKNAEESVCNWMSVLFVPRAKAMRISRNESHTGRKRRHEAKETGEEDTSVFWVANKPLQKDRLVCIWVVCQKSRMRSISRYCLLQ